MRNTISDIQNVKLNNMKIVLDAIRKRGTVSRASIARITGLTRATVSSLVDELLEKGLVEEIGEGKSSGGRKPILLKLNANSYLAVGINLSDDKTIRGYLCNLEAEVVAIAEQKYENNFDSILYAILNIVSNLLKAVPEKSKIAGIGIGAAGIVNPSKKEVLFSTNFDILGAGLVKKLIEKYSLPVYIENESNAAAWAEKEYGSGKGFNNILYLSKGKGIGSGIIIDGNIYYGSFYGAGEIGHVMVDPNGMRCRCGAIGCLETFIGQEKILAQIKEKTGEELSINDAIKRYSNGDPDIKEVVSCEASYLGKALAISSSLLNIDQIILGGYIIQYGSNFLAQVEESFREHTMSYYRDRISIKFAKLGRDAVGIGGASLVLKRVWDLEIIR
ncbi:MAG TPA: ROK family protein [Clostridiaceae bacterium]|nr:ROK family protein [Clostridiaceae bacterium]